METLSKVIETLQCIQALFDGATTTGERDAAASALERMRARLKNIQESDPPIEYTFTMSDWWSKQLFVALLRRYELRPYRYQRQRHTTVMVRVSKSFVDKTLWPEFCKLDDTLKSYMHSVTEQVIREGVHADNSEPEVRQQLSGQAK